VKKAVFFFLLVIFSGDMIALALEPPAPEEIEAYRRDGSLKERIANAKALGNHLVAPHLMERLRYKLRRMALELQGFRAEEIEGILAPPPAWRGMPTKGTVKVLALLIEFSDYPHQSQNSKEAIESKLFGDGSGGAPYESLRNYYRRSSYNQLEIQGTVLGWYNTGLPRSSVLETTAGREGLIKTVLNYYNGLGHDFTQYDSDGDGAIDYLIVIWTGPDNGWANFWWGYMTSFTDSSYQIDGKRLETYSWQWEAYPYPGTFTPRVVIHETGHALGLPDYYDYDGSVGPKGGIGGLDMMDANFGDHNCFSKFLLEWINPAAYSSGNQMLTLYASGSTKDQNAIVVMPGAVQGDPFGEFFMVQNRHRVGNDMGYPNDGLLIWHVDSTLNYFGTDFVYDNSYTSHKLLRLMEADGLEEIEKDLDADGDDYYVSGKTFGTATTPNSNRYDGTETGVVVFDIGPSGNPMTFKLSIACPVPPAPGSPSPGDGATTVSHNPTLSWEAPGSLSFDIYFGTETSPPYMGTTIEPSFPVTGLSPNTLYRWQVAGTNSCGSVSLSPVWTFRTEVNPPGIASFSNITPSCIRANWTANGNPPDTEYLCRNETIGVESGWITHTFWDSCGLAPNVNYTFSVKARDRDGNESDRVLLGNQSTHAEGTVGTLVRIGGAGFGTKKGKVLIGTTALKILSWTDSLIESLVSKGIPSGIYDLVVLPKGLPEIRMEDYFSMRLPEIDSVEPDRGSVGEPISIQGRFFGTKKGKVYLDCGTGATTVRKSGKVTSWSMNATTGEGEIQFLVPKGLPVGSCDLTLTNPVGSATLIGGFVAE